MALPTRERLLRAARRHLAEAGFEGASLDKIRVAAKASNGSLFHFFPTRNHLIRAVYLSVLVDYQAPLLNVLRRDQGAQETVEQLIEAHIAWVERHRADARLLLELREATVIDGEAIDWGQANAGAVEALRAFIAKAVASGEMQELRLSVWLALVFAPSLQLVRTWVRDRRRVEPAVRQALARAAWRAVEKEQPDG